MSVRITPGDAGSSWQPDEPLDPLDRVDDPQDIRDVFGDEDPISLLPIRRRRRRPTRLIAAGLAATVMLALLGGLAVRLAQPAPPATVASHSGAPSAATVTPTVAGVAGASAIAWQGAALPVHPTAGPRVLTDTRATGFSHDPLGAALAATHIATHLDPYTGPPVFEPTLAEQVLHAPEGLVQALTRAYRSAARQQGYAKAAVAEGRPVLAPTGAIQAWRIPEYHPDAVTTVELRVAAPGGELLTYEIHVRWQDEDWRVWLAGASVGELFTVRTAGSESGFHPFITKGE